MKKILIALGCFFAAAATLIAQDFDNYQPLTCSGSIPKEFTLPSTQKYKAELKKIENKNYKKKEKKDRKQFALESNFVLDDLLQSGLVLFNDPVSNYLNEVAAVLVKADGQFKKPVRVYALRSSRVNAFATDRGTVFVTLGLLAQLENEAQLAYILSHELVHVSEGHTVDLFLEAKDIERRSSRRSVLNEATFDDNLLAKNRYSKELEMEADKKGLALFSKTKYSTSTLNTVFDVLKYSYLPFDEVQLERSFFETADFRFPDGYWAETVRPISGEDENSDDAKSSHPNIAARRQALSNALKNNPGAGGQDFLVSEQQFMLTRKMARYELPLLHLRHENHAEAIYTAHLLMQKEPSRYLQKCVAQALYHRAKYQNDDDYKFEVKIDSIEGELQRVYKLLDRLDDKEITVLALRYAWLLHRQYPEDRELVAITDDLFIELGAHFKSLDEFLSEQPAPGTRTDTAQNDTRIRSKYDKINDQKKATGGESAYWRTAFAGFVGDENFKEAFEKGQKECAKRKERREYYESKKGKSELAKIEKREQRKGLNLGIKKIVVLNPFYLKLDARKDNAVQYVDSEYGHERLRNLMTEMSEKSGLKVSFLDAQDLKENQSDRFNEIRLLNDWFGEQVRHDNLSPTPGLQQDDINALASKYGTDYFLWTGVISLREKKKNAALVALLGLIYWPVLPIAIAGAAKPEYDMLYYAVLYDVRTGRNRVVKFEYFDKRDSDTILKAHCYDTFVQISRD